jgi:four helix bundle protein
MADIVVPMSGTFEDLRVWQAAMKLVLCVYRATSAFPKHEQYGLSSQMRRAVVSVASNIAEGKGRASDRELVLFLGHSRGSLYELQTQVRIAGELGYLEIADTELLISQTAEVGRLLNGLIKAFPRRGPLEQPKA